MKPNIWIACGALLAGVSVAAGAFGAHWLTSTLRADASISPDEAVRRIEIFHKAVQYQMYHALGVALVGLIGQRFNSPCLTAAGWLFVAGIALFCGCLYAMGLGAPRAKIAMLAPIGGASFISGWICLTVAAWRGGT